MEVKKRRLFCRLRTLLEVASSGDRTRRPEGSKPHGIPPAFYHNTTELTLMMNDRLVVDHVLTRHPDSGQVEQSIHNDESVKQAFLVWPKHWEFCNVDLGHPSAVSWS